MAHTYSLIHDDLPALDNDDLRRGKPTCHVAFGEAIAILAGDALQNLAFQVISNLPAPPATIVAILHDFALAIGTGVGAPSAIPPGMIGGQVVDIEVRTPQAHPRASRAHPPRQNRRPHHHQHRLRRPPRPRHKHLGAPSVRAFADGWDTKAPDHTDIIARLRTFGENAGLAFQIVDDILDMTQTSAELGKTAGKDTASDKATWPAVYGIEQSKKDAASLIADAFAALTPFGESATPLKSLAQYLVDRTH